MKIKSCVKKIVVAIISMLAVGVFTSSILAEWDMDEVENSDAKSTEYILLASATSIDTTNDKAMSIGKPLKSASLTESSGGCGYYDDGLGGDDDSNYDGTIYGVYMLLADGSGGKASRIPTQTWLVGEDIGPAKHLTSWANLRSGDTCTESIDGTTYTFKKYSVTCDGCSAE